MPVTARLLQRLHETLGDEATNDLLVWWEEATALNRVAVREVADLYFARFGEHLDAGLAQVRGESERRFAELRAEFQTRLVETRAELQNQISETRVSLVKWMFLFWAGTIIPIAGLLVALLRR